MLVELIRSGSYVDDNGTLQSFTPADIRAMAHRYNTRQYSRLRAPCTFGKPSPTDTSQPAYGWIRRLVAEPVDGGRVSLLAFIEDYDRPFFDAIQRGEHSGRTFSIDPRDKTIAYAAWSGSKLPKIASKAAGATYSRPLAAAYSRAKNAVTITIKGDGWLRDAMISARSRTTIKRA